ncbi:hypothetical protein ACFSCV_15510 [Methylopila henanensis]|uniref:Class I SAM-dependent methyltransferase n=1 Tax=Methylopila henanensis TaxID=873516 RepID=A0ABW4K897_9HYPH
MTAADIEGVAAGRRAVVGAATVFTAAIGLSAFLLFAVQPMFAKMVLPTLGGAPGVWSVAMVFFQALLLGGYAYAHLITRTLTLRNAVIAHLAVLGVGFAVLPIAVAAGWGRPPADGEAIWLLGLFGASVGLPFFALSANGPLLQAWFAASRREGASDPYFLYAASNLGSVGALVAYPLVAEPLMALAGQSRLWTAGYAVLIGLIALAGFAALRGGGAAAAPAARDAASSGRWPAWVGLAFVPSALLVAVTAHITTDVAAAPLLWVAPLALFLLTFVAAFRAKPLIAPKPLAFVQVALTAAAFVSLMSDWPIAVALPLHLALLTAVALTAHGRLYALRPAAGDLTRFYLFMSLGGVLGGSFAALVAPRLFSTVAEYPLLLAAAALCLPGLALKGEDRRDLVAIGVIAFGAVALGALYAAIEPSAGVGVHVALTLAFAGGMVVLWGRPARVVPLALGAALVACGVTPGAQRGESLRSFFGVHRVSPTADGRFVTLVHGNTIHGAMRVANDDGSPYEGAPEPTTYYTREGALGQGVAAIRAARGGSLGEVAVIGLGSGSLACHRLAGETWRFLEIDDTVIRLARPGGRFPFVGACAPDAPLVLGDARLTMADQPGGFGLVVVDAFSSDAIPAHLMTREALALYRSKLAPGGAILMHVSNRHLELAPILARVGADLGLATWLRREGDLDEPISARMRTSVTAVMLAANDADVGPIATGTGWTRVAPDMARRPWTDDFSNILEAFAR